MDCASCSEQLSAYLDGELEPPPARAVEDHLTRCKICRTEFAELKRVRELVAELPRVSAPEGLVEEVAAHLEREALLRPAPREHGRTAAFRRTLGGLAAAAALALVAFGVWHVLFNDRADRESPATVADASQPKLPHDALASKDAAGPESGESLDGKLIAEQTKKDKGFADSQDRSDAPGHDRVGVLEPGIDAVALRRAPNADVLKLEWTVDDPAAARVRIIQIAHAVDVRSSDGYLYTEASGGEAEQNVKDLSRDHEDASWKAENETEGLMPLTHRQVPADSEQVVTLVVPEDKLPELVKELMASRQQVAKARETVSEIKKDVEEDRAAGEEAYRKKSEGGRELEDVAPAARVTPERRPAVETEEKTKPELGPAPEEETVPAPRETPGKRVTEPRGRSTEMDKMENKAPVPRQEGEKVAVVAPAEGGPAEAVTESQPPAPPRMVLLRIRLNRAQAAASKPAAELKGNTDTDVNTPRLEKKSEP